LQSVGTVRLDDNTRGKNRHLICKKLRNALGEIRLETGHEPLEISEQFFFVGLGKRRRQ
jgi:hypothetical protein